ncbi:hypothetical protein F4808DRAFT_451975 [Astrocystis sublimbata]|nr:hypothetical protein F4808DRAFT_451975 [Astrocystis sublimbata]
MASTRSKSTLVIGIDFGTTYTGVSWLFFKENAPVKDPEVVTHWLSALSNNNDRTKVPSKIHYNEETGEVQWGYNIPTDVQSIQWFKLLLLDSEDLPATLQNSTHIQAARDKLKNLGKTAVEVIGDYLKVLWKHIIAEIQDEKGRSMINGTPYHVILSAAERAGILEDRIAGKTALDFISEPEAAALATLPELDNRDDLKVGDTFVVMDAGGGTVDIISYKVENLEPMVVSECVEGDGALCGATFVDTAFESWNSMETSAIKKMMNSEWEHGIKKDFDGSQQKYCIDLPKRNKRGQVAVNADEIRKVFEHVLSQMYDMLQKQLDSIMSRTKKSSKFVILVGGFGRCPFLFRSLRSRFDETDILQARGERPWSAICRGSVLAGATGCGLIENAVKVKSRVARMCYGWRYQTPFDENLHDTRDKVWSDLENNWMATSQMEWVIKRGQDISALEPKSYRYHRLFKYLAQGKQNCTETFYTSTDVCPSSRHDDTVHTHSAFKFETSRPAETMEIRTKNGNRTRIWRYHYEIVVSGNSLAFKIISAGEEVGSSSLTVESN